MPIFKKLCRSRTETIIMMKPVFRLVLLVLLLLLVRPTAVLASSPPLPPPPDPPTQVSFLIGLLDLPELNVREQTFTIEGTLALLWHDPRLAFDPAETGQERLLYSNSEATRQLNNFIWSPALEFENSRGERKTSNATLSIDPDGTVYYQERFNATLATPLDLRDFPFDSQRLNITVASFNYAADQMVFSPDSLVVLLPEFTATGWRVETLPQTEIILRGAYGLEWAEEGEEELLEDLFSTAIFTIPLTRDPGFYVWKLLVPLFIITSISWVSFWRSPGLGPRMNMTFSCMLTVVAYNFVIANTLPPITYLTRLDMVFILTYLFIALTIVQNTVASYWHDHGRVPAARRLDRHASWLIPLAYMSIYAVLLFV